MLKNHVDMCIITASTATITKNEKTKFVHFALRWTQETEMPKFMMAKSTKPTKTPTKIQYTIKLMYRQQTTHFYLYNCELYWIQIKNQLICGSWYAQCYHRSFPSRRQIWHLYIFRCFCFYSCWRRNNAYIYMIF